MQDFLITYCDLKLRDPLSNFDLHASCANRNGAVRLCRMACPPSVALANN
jgi:hypothetical protein